MMPLKDLRVALANIMIEVERLEALLPPSMVAIQDRPLPKGDYTIEATKGFLSAFTSSVHTLTNADRLKDYDHFYDDYCIAHYLLGLVAKQIAFFPDAVFEQDMCTLATKSFRTVFRYAPYIKDDTYAYYFSHYNMGLILLQQGQPEMAEEKFKYLLSTINPTLRGLPNLIAGRGRNSLEVLIMAKAHAAMFLLTEDRERAAAAAAEAEEEARSALRMWMNGGPNAGVRGVSFSTVDVSTKGHGPSSSMAGMGLRARQGLGSSVASSSDVASMGSGRSSAKLTQDFRQFPIVDPIYQR